MRSIRKSKTLAVLLMGLAAGCMRSPDAPPDASREQVAAAGAAVAPSSTDSPPAQPSGAAAPTDQTPQVLEGIPSKIAMPPKDAETPPIAAGAEVTYVCESGMPLRISYDGVWANVAWTNGGSLRLTLTASASGTGERYAGQGYVLSRMANVVELIEQNGGQTWRCAEGAANA